MGIEGSLVAAHLEHQHVPPVFVILIWAKNDKGKDMLIIDGYTFSLMRKHVYTDHYWCSVGRKCKSRVILTRKINTITKAYLEHCHPRKKFMIRDVLYLYNSSGKRTALLNGYSFYCDGRWKNDVWQCTNNGTTNCRARFVATKDGELIRWNAVHTHLPPNYVIRDGVYIKIYYISLTAVFNGYSFYCDGRWKNDSWLCTNKNVYTKSEIIQYVLTPTEKRCAIMDGYSYYHDRRKKTKDEWKCAKGGTCSASFVTNESGEIRRTNTVHTHAPPFFFIRDGIYFEI
ncbi:uncharacterized protein [Maniola hyperantus]|uniref:uncharacterized protein n=1 Tax=Aphantopus hyperantus TaxID=2795564 RepID=UPI00374850DB